jgi:hypothetical protein
VLQPHRQANGYVYFKATHRAIIATVKPAGRTVGPDGGSVLYLPPPPQNDRTAPPPPPTFQTNFLPGSVPAGATVFVHSRGLPTETPGNAPSLGSSFTLGCTTSDGQPCQLTTPAPITFDISQFANTTGSYSLGLYRLAGPTTGRAAQASDRWVRVGALACDAATKQCVGTISSFGTFAVLDERSYTFVPLALESSRP